MSVKEPFTDFRTGETKILDGPFPPSMLECITEYLRDDAARVRGQDIYPGVFDNGLFFPLQRKRELAQMMRIARSVKPITVLDIGSDKGGGLYHWVKCLPTVERVIASEIRGTPYAELFEKAFPEIEFLWLTGSSYDPGNVRHVASWLCRDSQQLIDCLFIDGDKSHFLADFYSYLPWMSRGSIVFMHDFTDQAPGAAFNIAKQGRRHEVIHDVSEVGEIDKPRNAYEHWLRLWNGASCGVGVIHVD